MRLFFLIWGIWASLMAFAKYIETKGEDHGLELTCITLFCFAVSSILEKLDDLKR